MQTLTVEVKDEFMPSFLSQLREMDDVVIKDKNLEIDQYFYERKAQIEKDLHDIDAGKIKMLGEDEYKLEMDNFFQKLEKNMQINRSDRYYNPV